MKLKIYLLIVAILLLIKLTTNAQSNYTTYQFLSEADDKALTVKNGLLSFENKKTGVGIYNQLFIMKRTNAGKVILVSASEEQLHLKRQSGSVILSTGTHDTNSEWEINYTGFPFITIAIPGSPLQTLRRQGNNLVTTSFTPLTNNSDQAGNYARLKIHKVTNTF